MIKKDKTNDQESGIPVTVPVAEDVVVADVYSSYIFSTSRRSISKYGERLLMEVISEANDYILDKALGINKLNFTEIYNEKFAVVDIPIKKILNESDRTNYTAAKKAALELMEVYHSVELPLLDGSGQPVVYNDGTPQYKLHSFHLLSSVDVNAKPGIVSVKLGAETWQQILDMGKGYTRYHLMTAKKLNNVVAIRLFQILSNTKESLYFSLDKIMNILDLTDKKYTPSKFITRFIEPALTEIGEKCPFRVEYETVLEEPGKSGRRGVVGLIFRKVVPDEKKEYPFGTLDSPILNVLKERYKFNDPGIRANLELFEKAKNSVGDFMELLDTIWKRAKSAKNPQGYLVKSLRNLISGDVSRPTFSVAQSKNRSVKETPVSPVGATEMTRPDRLKIKTLTYSDNDMEEL